MRYQVNFKDILKKLFFPLDVIKVVLIIAGLIWLIGAIYASQIFFSIFWTVEAILIAVGVLILITIALCEYAISKFFSNFNGEFEKRFSLGFKVIVYGFLFRGVAYIGRYLTFPHYVSFSNYFTWRVLWDIVAIIISLFILYGFILLVSAINYYKSTKILPTTPPRVDGINKNK